MAPSSNPSDSIRAASSSSSRSSVGGRSSASTSAESQRAKSGDLTGEREGREPSSQDDLSETTSSLTLHAAPEDEAVPVDVALDVEEVDSNLFRSKSLWQPARARGVFGGQVIGQAVASAAKTVREEMRLHSLHCYFLLAGKGDQPIIYIVSRVRDGGSYCTRQVEAQQNARCIFTMFLSYQVPEPHQPAFAIPLPEGSGGGATTSGSSGPTPSSQILPLSSSFTRSPTPNDLIASLPSPEQSPLNEQRYVDILREQGDRLPSRMRSILQAVVQDRLRSPVEIRNALPSMYDEHSSLPSEGYEQAFWLRTRQAVAASTGGGAEAQKAALAYLSDFQFLSTIPKALGNSKRIKMMASLDHSMWFYQDFDVHEWLLFVMQAQAASNGRGVVLGRIYRRDGTLVAVLAQEGMVREKLDTDSSSKQAKL